MADPRVPGVVLLVCGALTALACSPVPFASSATVLWAGPTGGSVGQLIPDGLFGTPATFLGGAFRDDEVTVIDYPASLWPATGILDPTIGMSVEIGTATIVAQARSTPGPLVLAGVSQGGVVVQHAAALLNDDPSIPSDTTFIIIANPNLGMVKGLYGAYLPILNYTPRPLAETRFNTIVVINQYDGWADPIVHPSALAFLNAVMAMVYLHPFAQNTDLSAVPAENVTTTTNSQGGTTTTYYVPAEQLPLTMPLRRLGVRAEFVDRLDGKLRTIIDAAYSREDVVPASNADGVRVPAGIRTSAATTRAHGGAPPRTASRENAATRWTPARPVTASAPPRDSSSRPDATGTSGRRSPVR